MDLDSVKGIVTGFKDKCKVIYFREGYTFRTSDLDLQDGCLILKAKGIIEKAWGHSPGALLPLAGKGCVVQLVNARDGNPCDPFKCVDKKEKFSDTSIRASAKEQHYKSMNTGSGTGMSTLQRVVLCLATFNFLVVGITYAVKNWG